MAGAVLAVGLSDSVLPSSLVVALRNSSLMLLPIGYWAKLKCY